MKRRPSYYVAYAKRMKERAFQGNGHFHAASVQEVVSDFDEYINELVAEVRRLREKCNEDPEARTG